MLLDDGRSISRNVSHLNILFHDVINLLYYGIFHVVSPKQYPQLAIFKKKMVFGKLMKEMQENRISSKGNLY